MLPKWFRSFTQFSKTRKTAKNGGFGRKIKAARSFVFPRLAVENLEERLVLSTVNWINPNGGDWDTAANWSSGNVPGASDDAVIPQSGLLVTHVNGNSDSVGSITSSSTLEITSGTLSIAGSSTLSALIQTGGTLTGAGTVTVTGQTVWTGGTMTGGGITNAQGGLQLGGVGQGDTERLDGRAFNNSGEAFWQGTGGWFDQLSGSVFTNLPSASLTIQSDLTWYNDSGNSTFNNQGALAKDATLGATFINVAFNNSGTVDMQSGALSLQNGGLDSGAFSVETGAYLGFDGNGTTTLSPSSQVAGAGVVEMSNNATVNVAGAYNGSGVLQVNGGNVKFTAPISSVGKISVTGGTLDFSTGATVATSSLAITGGTLTGSDTLTVSGMTVWTGGTMSGTGVTNAHGGLQLGSVGQGDIEVLNTRALNNAGAAFWLGSGGYFDQLGGSVFNNLPGASLTIQSDLVWYNDSGNSSFINQGALIKNTTTHTTYINVAFSNRGSVDVQSGALSLQNGGLDTGSFIVETGAYLEFDGNSTTTTLTPSSSLAGAGAVEMGNNATVNIGGAYDVSGALVDGANVNFTAPVTTLGAVSVSSGTLNFSTGVALPLPTLSLRGGTLSGSDTLTVRGLTVWTSGTLCGSGITNANGGLQLGSVGQGDIERLDGRA